MSTAAPLIARLRRRLMTGVWLLSFVVLAKGTLASLCLADGLTSPDARAEAATTIVSAEVVAAQADDDGLSCWHAGDSGCHCLCVHACALPVTASAWAGAPQAGTRVALPPPPLHHVLLLPLLRPPIA